MRSVSLRLEDMRTMVLNLGYVGENEHTRVQIDAKKMYDQYPNASASLTVCPPAGESYPAVIERDGDYVIWDIVDSYLTDEGSGEFQLSFTTGETVAKTFIGRFRVCRSIVPTGTIPSGLDDFLTRAGAALTAIPETINEALQEAKDSGEFDGADGVSPTVSITDITGGHRITITDAEGTSTADVMDGEDGDPGTPGDDGVSPTVTVTDITGGHRVTITDAEGDHTFDVMDGSAADIIDDESTANNKVWSAQKTNSLKNEINGKIDAPETAGTAGQVLGLDGNLEPEWKTVSGGGTVDSSLSTSSTNPVQNKVVTNALNSVEDFVMQNVGGSKLIQQSDLVIENSNFVVSDGSVYATSTTSPYNCMVINASKMEFKYRRRSASYQLFMGVCINDHFVGNVTNSVVTGLKEIYGTTNVVYSNVTINTSVADNTYGTDYNDYTATLDGQVFELKKGTTTILKFTVNDGITIQGIAILNYFITYSSTTDNTDLKNCTVVVDKITKQINDAVSPVQALATKADIIGGQSNHRVIAGAIRNSGNGWEFIVDTNHQADLNCVSVGVANNDGRLYVDYSGINAKKVISFIAAPDEAFANLGYVIGASVGLTAAYIQIFQYNLNSVSAQIKFENGNDGVEVSALNSEGVSSAVWNDTSKTLDITHSSVSGELTPIAIFTPSVYGKYLMRRFSSSGTGTRVEFIDTTTGDKATSPNAYMSFDFVRIGKKLQRDEIDPSTISMANANIWFMGIFEV